jgi:hypothetical protein
LLADQDCDLAWRALIGVHKQFLVELRPVYSQDPPTDWGIRSQTLRLDESGQYLRANSPSVHVTPEIVEAAEHLDCLDADSRLRLKTWFGMRYDRPAIPQRYKTLSDALARELSRKKDRSRGTRLRDVLAQFWTTDDGATRYSLVAVLPGGQYNQDHPWVAETRSWLAAVALAVPDELGTAATLEAYGDDDVSLAYVEGSFSLDLSKLSWPSNAPGPVGTV